MKEKILKVIRNISTLFGIIFILFGIIVIKESILNAIALICFALPFITPLRKKLCDIKFGMVKRIFIYLLSITLSIVLLGISSPLTDDITNNENNTESNNNTSEEIIISIDDLFENIDNYLNKDITVTGFCGWEAPQDENGNYNNYVFSEDWEHEIIVDDVNEALNGHVIVEVTGKLYKKDNDIHIKTTKYIIQSNNEENEENSKTNTDSKSVFQSMINASYQYSVLNWNQLLNNPTSLAGTYVYIPGKVVDVDYTNGKTRGLIDTKGDGNIRDMVSFIINGEVYDFNVGSIIAPMGTISNETGLATNSFTNQSVNTPLIVVDNPNLWRTEYSLDTNDKEISDYIYGTYEAMDSEDVDDYLGNKFEFTKERIGNHKYYYADKVYTNPSIKIGTGSLMRGYDNMRISMTLVADNIGSRTSDGGLKYTTVSIYLKSNLASINADGDNSEYYKIN